MASTASLLVVLVAAAVVPDAPAEPSRASAPPVACAGLVQQLSDTMNCGLPEPSGGPPAVPSRPVR
uniref:hypothetical protein n=1 Tax=Saccharothrix mutabilis TaxID=33921 RepID=UPI0031E46A6F